MDLSDPFIADTVIRLLDGYAKDEMGGSEPLSEYSRQNLVKELQIKTSNICCGSSGGAGISSGGAGISSGGAGFSSGDAGILVGRVRVRWCYISSGGAGITSGGFSDSDSQRR